ncbi:MAG: SRPBCC domain-containing protein [Chloroflexota bacterium]
MNSTMVATRSVVIAADRERVWKAITEAAQISQWFDGSMKWEFEAKAGETMTFYWDGQVIGYGKVVTAEPPERFAFRWTPEPGTPIESLVTFQLEVYAEGTRVTISEAGFEALPEAVRQKRYEMNGTGWGITLDHLTAYLRDADS